MLKRRHQIKVALVIGILLIVNISILNSTQINSIKARGSPLQFEEKAQKTKILILYDNNTNILPSNATIFGEYLNDLGWVSLDYRTSITNYRDLEDYNLVIFLGYSNFTSISQFIIDYIYEGGSLLLLPPIKNLENFNNFTRILDISVLDEVIIDNSSYVGDNKTVLVKDAWVKESPVLSDINELVFPNARPLNITGTWNLTMDHVAYKLVWGANTTKGETVNGSDVVFVAGVETVSGSKILIYSTPYIALNDYINMYSNKLLLINSIKWLVGNLGYLKIENVYISGKYVVKGVNSTVFVNFTVSDQFGKPMDVDAQIYLIRLGKVLKIVNASKVSNGYFEANVSFEDIKPSTVELWIIVHKQYYGYYLWPGLSSGGYEIVVFEYEKISIFPNMVTTFLSMIIPILAILALLVLWYPKYRENKELIKEIEE